MKYTWEAKDCRAGRFVKARHYLYPDKAEFFMIGVVLGIPYQEEDGKYFAYNMFLMNMENGNVHENIPKHRLYSLDELAEELNQKQAIPLHDFAHFVERFTE